MDLGTTSTSAQADMSQQGCCISWVHSTTELPKDRGNVSVLLRSLVTRNGLGTQEALATTQVTGQCRRRGSVPLVFIKNQI